MDKSNFKWTSFRFRMSDQKGDTFLCKSYKETLPPLPTTSWRDPEGHLSHNLYFTMFFKYLVKYVLIKD